MSQNTHREIMFHCHFFHVVYFAGSRFKLPLYPVLPKQHEWKHTDKEWAGSFLHPGREGGGVPYGLPISQ